MVSETHTIDPVAFGVQFKRFQDFIQLRSGQPFTGFDNPYIQREEHYKVEVQHTGLALLSADLWNEADLGRGLIHAAVTPVVQPYFKYNGLGVRNNLVNWRAGNRFALLKQTAALEAALFQLYRGADPGEAVYDALRTAGVPYQVAAYLFFLRDPHRFLPISQEKFDQAFKLLGVKGFRTWGKSAWSNYETFLRLIGEVKVLLERELGLTITLLDAHSFVWIVAAQMRRPWRLAEHTAPPKIPQVPFFSREDIQRFATIVDRPYDAQEDKVLLALNKAGIFDKSNAWMKALVREGWAPRPDSFPVQWNRFKPYSWAQLCREGQEDRMVFFTFGVDAPAQALVYKLECRDSGGGSGAELLPDQVRRFEAAVEGSSANWQQIGVEDLANWDWHRLLEESHRFMAENEGVYDEAVAAVWDDTIPGITTPRSYQRPNEPFVFKGGTELPPEGDEAGMRKGHMRRAKLVQPHDKHLQMSRGLTAHLRRIHGHANVEFEHRTGKGTAIDVVARTPEDGIIFYEIKAYSDLRYGMREALGQLLEYAFWPSERNAARLVIVSHLTPDAHAKGYLAHLRQLYNMPVYYQQWLEESKELGPLI